MKKILKSVALLVTAGLIIQIASVCDISPTEESATASLCL